MKLTEKINREIAENLDCGLRCFFNLKTSGHKTFSTQIQKHYY
jgi:hypothetical protein